MSEITAEAKDNKSESVFRRKKILPILILLGIAVIVAAGIGISFLMPKDISGGWELVVNPEVAVSTADEIPESDKVFYVFDKPDRYGRGEYYTCYQSGVEYYKYELMEENGVRKINLGTEDMEYIISGSKLLGNAKLTIIFPEYTDETTGATYDAQEYIFLQAKDPRYEKQAYKDYETDSLLSGEKWTSNQRSLAYYYYYFSYVETVEFTNDGIMIIHYESDDLALDRYMYYAYTAKDSELTFSPVTDKDTKYTVGYEFDEDGNLKFINDTTSASIFADAFFGEFTFYTEANLPEPTAATTDELYFSE